MPPIIDILINALPNWLPAWWHSQVDILLSATPAGYAAALSQLMIIAGFSLVLVMGWEFLGCDVKDY